MRDLKIVIMDGHTSVMDDLNWDALKELGSLTVYDRTPRDKIVERARGADVVLTNKVPFFKGEFDALPSIKYIGVLATGYNNVDLNEARARGVEITNIPAYSTNSVSQMVFSHILNIATRVQTHADAVRCGAWCKSADICFCLTSQVELAGKTLGIVGFGRIGRKIAELAGAFDMKVIAFSPSRKIGGREGNVEFVSLDELFLRADIISLNCLLNEKTSKLINAESISKMKRGVWIINTGRGGLVDEAALGEALKNGRVGAAGVDVLSVEPPASDNPLLSAPNCFITPHIAWTTREARSRLIKIAYENLREWAGGEKPKNSLIK